MSLINKMNVGNTNYDIQDRLMPEAIGQAGQVLKVKDDGSGLEFGTIESGGGKLYRHTVTLERTEDSTTYYFIISFVDTKSTAYTFEEMVSKQVSLSYNVGCYYESTGTQPNLDFAVPDSGLTDSNYFFVFKFGGRPASGIRLNTLRSDKVTEV